MMAAALIQQAAHELVNLSQPTRLADFRIVLAAPERQRWRSTGGAPRKRVERRRRLLLLLLLLHFGEAAEMRLGCINE